MRPLLAPVDEWRDVEAEKAGSTLTVDLGALTANWRLLRDRAPRSECAAVVKADAYGLGLTAVAPASLFL